MHPELAEFFQENGYPSRGDYSDIQIARTNARTAELSMVRKLGTLQESLEEKEIFIPLPDGSTSRAIIHRPRKDLGNKACRLIVLYYGGGFMLGSPETMAPYSRGLAKLFDAVVLCPTYRTAPEYPFPAGINDAWECLKWAGANAAVLGADPSKGFIVGGISAGGNFAAVLSRRSVEEKLAPPLTGQWVSVPVMFQERTVPKQYKSLWTSWEENKNALIVNAADGDLLFGFYKPDFSSPLFNPLSGIDADDIEQRFDVGLLPPAYVQVAGLDLTRDDGIIYARELQDAGVKVRLDLNQDLPHSFWHFFPQLDVSKKAICDIAAGVAWLLDVDVDISDVGKSIWVPE